ncbi:MAG: HD domain-containing protein [Candidatus Korarchaeota archaeon]|nr:HD domain-containing protein [Candidatus Korarchaeota archaeon]
MVHTRFEHSLGVFELTRRILEWIRKNASKEGILEESGIDLIEERRRGILASALLHDIGHAPLSHTLDGVLTEESHEEFGIFLIENSLIKEDVDEELVEEALKILKMVYAKEKLRNVTGDELVVQAFSNQLLGSQMDADRMDFLIRDSYHSGVQYGMFDVERMLRVIVALRGNLAVNRPPERSVPIVEEFVLSRYEMYRQVYHHKVSESYNGMLRLLITKLRNHGSLKLVKKVGREPVVVYSIDFWDGGSYSGEVEYRYFDDTWVLQLIKSIMRRGIVLDDNREREIVENLARGILHREHYRAAYTIEDDYVRFREVLFELLVRRKEEIDEILRQEGSFSFAKKVRGYQLQEENGEREEVYILNSEKDDLEPISFYSRLLKNVARSFLPIFRIYTPTGELPREIERIIEKEKKNADARVKGE